MKPTVDTHQEYIRKSGFWGKILTFTGLIVSLSVCLGLGLSTDKIVSFTTFSMVPGVSLLMFQSLVKESLGLQ